MTNVQFVLDANQNYDVDFICNECVSWSVHEIQFVLGTEFRIVT